jgi:hypothetical protein
MKPKNLALLFNMDGTFYYAYVGVTENTMSSHQLARVKISCVWLATRLFVCSIKNY